MTRAHVSNEGSVLRPFGSVDILSFFSALSFRRTRRRRRVISLPCHSEPSGAEGEDESFPYLVIPSRPEPEARTSHFPTLSFRAVRSRRRGRVISLPCHSEPSAAEGEDERGIWVFLWKCISIAPLGMTKRGATQVNRTRLLQYYFARVEFRTDLTLWNILFRASAQE